MIGRMRMSEKVFFNIFQNSIICQQKFDGQDYSSECCDTYESVCGLGSQEVSDTKARMIATRGKIEQPENDAILSVELNAATVAFCSASSIFYGLL